MRSAYGSPNSSSVQSGRKDRASEQWCSTIIMASPDRSRVAHILRHLDAAPTIDFAKHYAEASVAGLQTRLNRPHQAGFDPPSASGADFSLPARPVALDARDQQARALG